MSCFPALRQLISVLMSCLLALSLPQALTLVVSASNFDSQTKNSSEEDRDEEGERQEVIASMLAHSKRERRLTGRQRTPLPRSIVVGQGFSSSCRPSSRLAGRLTIASRIPLRC